MANGFAFQVRDNKAISLMAPKSSGRASRATMHGRTATNFMDAMRIMEAIKQRRDLFWDRQILGTASDPPVYSEAELARAVADEYDSLLIQLGVITREQAKSA
jgi:hypothetical protein